MIEALQKEGVIRIKDKGKEGLSVSSPRSSKTSLMVGEISRNLVPNLKSKREPPIFNDP